LGGSATLEVEYCNLLNSTSIAPPVPYSKFLVYLYHDGNEVKLTSFGKTYREDAEYDNWVSNRDRQFMGISIHTPASFIPPFGSAHYNINLTDLFELDKPGLYFAVIRYFDRADGGLVGGMARFSVPG